MADDEFKELMKDWTVYFSKRKQRDYYYNSKTSESLWTLEEVHETVKKSMAKKEKSKKHAADKHYLKTEV
jgi:hypothetical protein